jgi:uncharacterized membrane protein
MGTCIGRRNTRYFVGFLLSAGFICIETSAICLGAYGGSGVRIMDFAAQNHDFWSYTVYLIALGVGIYTAILSFMLLPFGI